MLTAGVGEPGRDETGRMPYISPSSAPPSPTGTSSAPPRAGPASATSTASSTTTTTTTATTTAAGSAPVRRHGRHCSEPAVSFQRPSSSSYLHRHRRSPTIRAPVARLQQFEAGCQQGQQQQVHEAWTAPGTGMGLVLSPPESRSNSSDEDESKKLQAQGTSSLSSSSSATTSTSTAAADKTNEGSGKGILIYSVPEQATQTPEQSDQDEEEMPQKPPMLRKKSGELVRPAIRLRQGRPLSMPGTPTFSKAVHFGAQLEEVRHFMQLDRPLAVSAGSSPVEEYDGDTEFPFTCSNAACSSSSALSTPSKDHWEARVTNFPSMLDDARLNKPVRLRRIQLCPDTHALLGTVAVANISYSKHVSARFTLDNWKTVSEVTAEYVHANAPCIDRDERVGFDTFSFSIELADQLRHGMQNKTLFLCLRYNVGGREFWDNNDDMNYQIVFSRRASNTSTSGSGSSGSVGRDPLFRARMAKAKNARGGRAKPLSMVAMGMNLPMNMPITLPDNVKVAVKQQTQFEITASKPGDSDVDVDSEKEGWFPDPDSPTRKNKLRTNVFGDRYDFSASLTTSSTSGSGAGAGGAGSAGPARYGHKHSHSMPHLNMVESSSASASASASSPSTPSDSDESPSPVGEKRLSDFLSDRPNHQSQVYKELVDRYCFFGSTKSRRSGVSSKDGTGAEEVDEDTSTPTMPMSMSMSMSTSTATSLNMHHLAHRLSPGPGGHTPVSTSPSASTSASPSDTEGLATPPAPTSASTSTSTSVRPSFTFGRPRPASERGMPASPAPAPAPTAILG
ncbi:TPA_exp: putative Protein phosphatase regulatory subunit Gac1 [Trichophyton benhamiae CBS 112371]|uniref:Protein phosphatase regulatory subunit Gac1, putative n=1 Tax=Arthroderma benhamiae (strain ATCC MYA-4681 / CBS 112371) TaxID=663331 RepID=D4AWK8_ARTBC|nr:protein phosphatase regulatory subunit Gac1, putative [Trichophyton benhamiae CBS 112371]EFE32389.1 protein phosphatase regulatory subunit Gac1, putative [Trichophyton benhamiae CBS 112371]DAA75484.1 TPA_exp: putative Protein phosphatase regulatory subunit Gac1 [Trichophyton benhamiae CBS 112371]